CRVASMGVAPRCSRCGFGPTPTPAVSFTSPYRRGVHPFNHVLLTRGQRGPEQPVINLLNVPWWDAEQYVVHPVNNLITKFWGHAEYLAKSITKFWRSFAQLVEYPVDLL